MNIVVIDNIDWIEKGAGFSDIKPFGFITTSTKSFEGVVTDLKDLFEDSPDYVYLINVHCIFSGGDSKAPKKYYYQDQNGVKIYRQLLKQYENNESNLKVAFFSPLAVEDLVKDRPGNVVLEHHLVLSTPFNWQKVTDQIKAKNDWTIFNNASENLLAGWSLAGRKSINTNGKDIVFVDDQTPEWKTVYKTVTDNPKAFYFATYLKNEKPKDEFSPNKIKDAEFRTKAHQADLIISDFYLQESHEINTWKSSAELAKVSGYQLYKHIKNELNAGIPMLIHTSSNKVRYYQFLDRSGIDDWASKDIRAEVSNAEKQYNYESIKHTIEKFTIGEHAEIYTQLKDFWRRIEKLKDLSKSNWWYEHNDTPCQRINGMKKVSKGEKHYMIDILTDAYFAIRAYLKREDLLADDLNSKDDNFTASAIAANIGKIYELLEFEQNEYEFNLHQRFFMAIRNAAAHYMSYREFYMDDVLLYFQYWLLALEDSELNHETKFAIEFKTDRDGNILTDTEGNKIAIHPWLEQPICKFRLLYVWIQFYNSQYRPKQNPDKFGSKIKDRIHSILNSVNCSELLEELTSLSKVRRKVTIDWQDHNTKFKIVPDGIHGRIKLTNA